MSTQRFFSLFLSAQKTGTNSTISMDLQGHLDVCGGIQDNTQNTWGIKRNKLGIKRIALELDGIKEEYIGNAWE